MIYNRPCQNQLRVINGTRLPLDVRKIINADLAQIDLS